MLGSFEVIKLVSTNSKVLGTILEDIDEITLGIDIETYLSSLYGSFDASNDVKLEVLYRGDPTGSIDSEVFCFDEGMKLVLSGCNLICIILGNVDRITLGMDSLIDLYSLN